MNNVATEVSAADEALVFNAEHVHGVADVNGLAVASLLKLAHAESNLHKQSQSPAVFDSVAVTVDEPIGALGGGGDGHGHGFSFQGALEHHNLAYPAVEWLHWKPILIFDLAKYTTKSADHWYDVGLDLDESAVAAYRDMASDEYLLAKWQAKMDGKDGADSEGFATALAGAGTSSLFGTFPSWLSWVNQQTFFGTVALLFMTLLLVVLGKRRPDELKPKNALQHVIESVVLFVRDDIVRPNVHHGADAWVPHIASIFFAVLAMNLMGLVPGTGTATGNLGVTAAFALMTLGAMVIFGMKAQGAYAFWRNLIPVPFSWNPLDFAIFCILAVIEVMGLLIKPCALCIRLFANMFGGHTVLLGFLVLGFVLQSAGASDLVVVPLGGFGLVVGIAVYLLELLVAFLQAYVFTLLTAVFIGASLEAEH